MFRPLEGLQVGPRVGFELHDSARCQEVPGVLQRELSSSSSCVGQNSISFLSYDATLPFSVRLDVVTTCAEVHVVLPSLDSLFARTVFIIACQTLDCRFGLAARHENIFFCPDRS